MGKVTWAVIVLAGCVAKPPRPGEAPVLAVGSHHACYVAPAGTLWCWGDNEQGQISADAATYVGTPVQIGTAAEWSDVVAGDAHTCGTLRDQVFCWGANDSGQCGSPPSSTLPLTAVDLPTDAVPAKLFAGGAGTCALDGAGLASCWGKISAAELPLAAPTAVTIGTSAAWTQLALGDDHACGLDTTGAVYCWGNNVSFQLGYDDGTTPASIANPIHADAGTTFVAIAVHGAVSCGITTDQFLRCWGDSVPQLTGAPASSPGYPTDSFRDWSSVSLGPDHACALADGEVRCWGLDELGALGDGFDPHPLIPDLPAISSTAAIEVGDSFSCALGTDATVSCWGSNKYGELGNGEVATAREPTLAFTATTDIVDLVVAAGHSCALAGTALSCWGDNRRHQITASTDSFITQPVQAIADPLDQVAVGTSHTCGRLTATPDTIKCWGGDDSEQLGMNGGTVMVDSAATAWTQLAAGGATTCAIDSEGVNGMYCWGEVPGLAGHTAMPRRITGGWSTAASSVSVGTGFAIGVRGPTASLEVAEWGGDCSTSATPDSPMTVVQPSNTTYHVAAAQDGLVACAVSAEPRLTCWGDNSYNQISSVAGGGCYPPQEKLVDGVTWATGPEQLAVGGHHVCSLSDGGELYCWGANPDAELGGVVPASGAPAPILVNDLKWSRVATAAHHTCAVDAGARNVYCWGLDRFGEIGNGMRFHETPVRALTP